MNTKSESLQTRCPIAFALDLFGDKWSLLIVRDLIFKGKTTYGDFMASSEGIATNVLAQRLLKLEQAGFITKRRDPDNARKYIYEPTDKAMDLLPLMLEMIVWSAKHDVNAPQSSQVIHGGPRDIVRRIGKDRAGVIAEILRKLKEEARNTTAP